MWFILSLSALNLFIIWIMPKYLTKHEIYVTWFVLGAIGINSDLIFGNIIDLYDFHKPTVEYIDLFTDAFFSPSFGIIYLNFLPNRKVKTITYILLWIALSVSIEWITVWVGFEKLKGWTPWYSIPIYLLVFAFLVWHLKFIRSYIQTTTKVLVTKDEK